MASNQRLAAGMASGILSAILLSSSATAADGQSTVTFCGHAEDGATASCSVVTPGGLFIAISPFTFFPFLIIWAISCWCCLKENDIEPSGLFEACGGVCGSCNRGDQQAANTRRQPPALLLSSPGDLSSRPGLSSVTSMTGNATFAPTPAGAIGGQLGNDSIGIQMTGSSPITSTASNSAAGRNGLVPEDDESEASVATDLDNDDDNSGAAARRAAAASSNAGRVGLTRNNSGGKKAAASAANNKKAIAAAAAARARLDTTAAATTAGGAGSSIASPPPVPTLADDDGIRPGRWVTGEWRCGSCTSVNATGTSRCALCDALKPSSLIVFTGPAKPVTKV